MLKVLVVDDTETTRRLLCHIINMTGDMEVVGQAADGSEAVRLANRLHPDVILMDITMPVMDGLEATHEIMHTAPTPIVMISGSIAGREAEVAFQALKQGALTLLSKPVGPMDPRHQEQIDHMVRTVRAMADVRVIHHRPVGVRRTTQPRSAPVHPEIIGIVASTGGPAALAAIIAALPADFNVPIVIVQHIAPDFLPSLTDWINSLTPLNVTLAAPYQRPLPGWVYLAPGGAHLQFAPDGTFTQCDKPVTAHMPSGDMLLESIGQVYGAAAVGVILTGMGADGVNGLAQMYAAGAMTLAQNEASSVVFGMPAEAIRRKVVHHIVPLGEVASALVHLCEE